MVGDNMANEEIWNGIDTEGVEKVMVNILDYADKANKILNNISLIVSDTEACFNCQSGVDFRGQFELIKSEFTILNKNFLSYNTDFIHVIQNYRSREEYGTNILNDGTKSVDVSLEKWKEN